jgi:hypothetical protein
MFLHLLSVFSINTYAFVFSVKGVRSEVLTAVTLKIKVVRHMTLCSLIDGYQSFRGTLGGDEVVGILKESWNI